MPTNERFVSATPQGWSVDSRGYIHGGFDTPVFLEAKQRFNSMKTRENRQSKEAFKALQKQLSYNVSREDADIHELRKKLMGDTPVRYIQPVAVYGDPGFNRPATKESNA